MSADQVDASGVVQREWANKYPQWALGTQTDSQDDTFCPDHLAFAPDYWLDKVEILEKLNTQGLATVKNHCKEFFKTSYAGKPVHRDSKPVLAGPKD